MGEVFRGLHVRQADVLVACGKSTHALRDRDTTLYLSLDHVARPLVAGPS